MIRSTEDSPPVKILYVGGYSRSGSTLVGRVLGDLPNTICLGETRFLWSRGLIDNVDCGCGAPFRSCPFWGAVGQEAFGGWEHVDADRLTEIDRVTNLTRSLPFYWAPRLRPGLSEMINDYVSRLAALYAAIARVSRAKVIIDISKDPTFACLLMRIPRSDVRIVHLVRDSRAVAYSWTRRRREPSPIAGQQFMGQFSPSYTAANWLSWNAAFHVLAGRSPYVRLMYESFVDNPRAALHQLSTFADEALVPAGSQLTNTEVKLGEHHIFSGNPMRTTSGWLPIRLDSEWQNQLSPAELVKVTAITWPLLRRYGYPIVPAARHAAVSVVDSRPLH